MIKKLLKTYKMKHDFEQTDLQQYNNVKIGDFKKEKTGKRIRHLVCKGIYKDSKSNFFALWQYVLAKTFKPYGKSTCFFEKIEN